MSDPTQALTNSVATLTTAGVALGTMGLVRDMVRDTQRRPRRAPPRRAAKRMPKKRKSVLDDPFGGDW